MRFGRPDHALKGDLIQTPLPSRLPTELNLSIAKVLAIPISPAAGQSENEGGEIPLRKSSLSAQSPGVNGTSRVQHDDSPSLTTQLASLFPSANDLTPESIARKQAQIRQELAIQEQYIATLLEKLLKRQAALRRQEGDDVQDGDFEESSISHLSSHDLDQKVQTLFQQLSVIREKAHKSEEIVRDITRDIRMLDTCKRNVVNSMTALKRLQMLVNAVSQLERLTKASRFREASSSLSAVKSLQSSFKGFAGVERVASIQREVSALQKELGDKARAEIESHFTNDANRPLRTTSVPDAALVIDALGAEAKQSLIDFYTTYQLREYRRIFRATDEAGQLDNVARRFAWFRRILKTYDEEHSAVFEEGPIKKWNVAGELLRKFTEITRQDIRSVLIRTQGKLQVPVLLEALSASLEFERSMSQRFGMPFAQLSAGSNAAESSVPSTPIKPSPSSQTTLSSAFDPYLNLFVEAQDRTLSEMIQTFKRQGTRASLDESSNEHGRDGAHTVLPSSTELFYFYGSVLEQCGRLSTREPFRDLCGVYKKHLQGYAEEVLKPLLQRTDFVRRSADVRASISDLQRICMVINTADYCATTSKQLEEKLKEKIDAEFRDSVDFEPERDVYLSVVSNGVQALTRELETSVEAAYQQMLRASWNNLDQTDIKSAYVDEFAGSLEHVAVVVRQDIQSKRYVRNWCDKVVGLVLARFMFNIVKLKPVSSLAAQQLLTDLTEIRMSLLELPRYTLSEEGSTSAASSYNRYVSKGIGRIETLLKLIAISEDSPPEVLVDTYIESVGDRSFSNFQKILDLKGIRKSEQNTLMDTFVSRSSQIDSLEDSSFLTTLDMDTTNVPGAIGLGGGSMVTGTDTPPASAGAGLFNFIAGGVGDGGTNTPPLGSAPRFSSPAGRGKGSGQGDAVGAGAQRAFSDLRRFGSMLVGRREASSDNKGR
ncbi:uncharacterized protein FA14DRAFT_164344 [Meira miltonrushii]|uniref:Uncharacterized protein n=1 Tax=Meira miltonrushii TaxID=1280837 RepID=A0A316VDR7_9BASI|nr:uncharacterized protein FA14DRAFT_164344 [Meira miltonrushii]PWN35464.1 hypothetical protein FA14DRAFT_164344 [Meira miltonrushii]